MNVVLERKKKVLLKGDERPLCTVLCPTQVSPDGKFIRLGEFFSDEVSGYYPLDEILEAVISVLQEF